MKLLAVLILIVTGCQTMQGTDAPRSTPDEFSTYLGRKGFFYLPVSAGETFVRCKPSKIVNIERVGASNGVAMTIEQEGVSYSIRNQSQWFDILEKGSAISFIDDFFKPELPKNRKIKFAAAEPQEASKKKKKPALVEMSSIDLICASRIFTGMTLEELVFVRGAPSKNNQTIVRGLTQFQYVYPLKPGSIEAEYYYISNGVLTGWQN